MCLIIAYSRAVAAWPLVFAANRDELRARPAIAMDILHEGEPLILGGRDLVANGTWLAVNEWGVVAALTNDPSTLPARDPSRRSRGEIPLRLARHRTAREAIAELHRTVRADEYNACFVLVGDRQTLHYLALGAGMPLPPVELPPGIHVLENLPLEARSRKVDFVRTGLPGPGDRRLLRGLWASLMSREVPPGPSDANRPPASEAALVDLGPYGTRWSGIVAVPRLGRPRFLFAEQPATSRGLRCADWATISPARDQSSSDSRT
jgi:hypothetical protein